MTEKNGNLKPLTRRRFIIVGGPDVAISLGGSSSRARPAGARPRPVDDQAPDRERLRRRPETG